MGRTKGKEADQVKMTIYMADETRRALRIRAIQEGTSATKLVERLIIDYLRTRLRGGR